MRRNIEINAKLHKIFHSLKEDLQAIQWVLGSRFRVYDVPSAGRTFIFGLTSPTCFSSSNFPFIRCSHGVVSLSSIIAYCFGAQRFGWAMNAPLGLLQAHSIFALCERSPTVMIAFQWASIRNGYPGTSRRIFVFLHLTVLVLLIFQIQNIATLHLLSTPPWVSGLGVLVTSTSSTNAILHFPASHHFDLCTYRTVAKAGADDYFLWVSSHVNAWNDFVDVHQAAVICCKPRLPSDFWPWGNKIFDINHLSGRDQF